MFVCPKNKIIKKTTKKNELSTNWAVFVPHLSCLCWFITLFIFTSFLFFKPFGNFLFTDIFFVFVFGTHTGVDKYNSIVFYVGCVQIDVEEKQNPDKKGVIITESYL